MKEGQVIRRRVASPVHKQELNFEILGSLIHLDAD